MLVRNLYNSTSRAPGAALQRVPQARSVRLSECRHARTVVTRDIRDQLVFLGTGTSHGVPVIGCGCADLHAAPTRRTSGPAAAWCSGLPEGNLLIDTPPDLRTQLLREGIGMVHAVLYTHEHADHLFGLDDLRIFAQYLGHDLPIYCDRPGRGADPQGRSTTPSTPQTRHYPAGGVPRLVFRRIATEPFDVLGARVIPIPLQHGRYPVLGFRFGNVAYCTDTNGIPPTSMALLEGLDVLVLDCLRRRPHPTHFSLDEAMAAARQLGPATDALHPPLPRPGARGDQRRAAAGHGGGVRRDAGAAGEGLRIQACLIEPTGYRSLPLPTDYCPLFRPTPALPPVRSP